MATQVAVISQTQATSLLLSEPDLDVVVDTAGRYTIHVDEASGLLQPFEYLISPLEIGSPRPRVRKP